MRTRATSAAVSSHLRGVGHRHQRGMRCGGRGSVRCAAGSQGGLLSVSERHACKTTALYLLFPPSLKLRRDMPRQGFRVRHGHAASKPWRRREKSADGQVAWSWRLDAGVTSCGGIVGLNRVGRNLKSAGQRWQESPITGENAKYAVNTIVRGSAGLFR
jgi:hypothetical protein